MKIDDMLRDRPGLRPPRPSGSMPLTLSDAGLLTLAVMPALLGFTSERRWLRYVTENLAGMFPALIGQSGYNKRIRKAFWLFIRVIRMLAMDTTLWSDDVWVVDSTPVECGRSRETAKRSDVAGWAEYARQLGVRGRVSAAVLLPRARPVDAGETAGAVPEDGAPAGLPKSGRQGRAVRERPDPTA